MNYYIKVIGKVKYIDNTTNNMYFVKDNYMYFKCNNKIERSSINGYSVDKEILIKIINNPCLALLYIRHDNQYVKNIVINILRDVKFKLEEVKE
jgi:hypothetical protein